VYSSFGLGEVLKRSVSEWARRLLVFIAATAVLCVPFIGLEVAIVEGVLPETWLLLGGTLAMYALGMLITAMVTHSVVYRIGGIVEMLTKSATTAILRLPYAILTALLVTLITALCFVPFVLVTIFAGRIAAFILSVNSLASLATVGLVSLLPLVALVGCVILAMQLSIKYSVAIPAVVMEDIGPLTAISRSKELTYDRKAQIFVLYLVIALVSLIGSAVLGVSVDTARGVTYSIAEFSGSGMAGGVATWVLMVVIMTWYATLNAVIYDELSGAENY
jgi:hypothetical protein